MAYETFADTTRTLSAMFDTREAADRAITALNNAGISNTALTGGEGADAEHRAHDPAVDPTTHHRGFFQALSEFFFPDANRYAYAEALARGGYLVTVTHVPQDMCDRALDILDDEGAIDMAAREGEWRAQGWQGFDQVATDTGGAVFTTGAGAAVIDSAAAGVPVHDYVAAPENRRGGPDGDKT